MFILKSFSLVSCEVRLLIWKSNKKRERNTDLERFAKKKGFYFCRSWAVAQTYQQQLFVLGALSITAFSLLTSVALFPSLPEMDTKWLAWCYLHDYPTQPKGAECFLPSVIYKQMFLCHRLTLVHCRSTWFFTLRGQICSFFFPRLCLSFRVSRLSVKVIWYVNGWTLSRDTAFAFEAARKKRKENTNHSRVWSNKCPWTTREPQATKNSFSKWKINSLHFSTAANLFSFSIAFPRLYFEDCDVNIVFVVTARSENTDGTRNVSPERVHEGWRLSAGCIITIIQLRWLSGEGYRCWGQRHRD